MDINGAKALKKRLSLNGNGEAVPGPAEVDIPADAPPVYHWLGVGRTRPEAESADGDDEGLAAGASLFRRLGLSFR